MARSINGNLIGAAARIDLQDQKEAENARRVKFSREWKQTLQSLEYFMTPEDLLTFWDSYPEKMTKLDFLPLMKEKLDEVDGTLDRAHAHIDLLMGQEGIKQSGYDDLADTIKREVAK
jgi:hypothetical protein